MTIESFFPKQQYSFCVYKEFLQPYDCINILLKWKDSGRPIRVIVTETPINYAMARTVCNDLGVGIGRLAQTGIPQKILCNGIGMYEIISKVYQGASKQNKKKYSIEMRQGKLCVDEVGKEVVATPISSDTNILESSYSENAEGVINRVKIYGEKDKYIGVVENNELIDLVGVFQDVYTKEKDKQVGTVANNMLRGIEQSMELTTLGNTSCISGKLVNLEDSETKQLSLFLTMSNSHSWSGGQHKTNMCIAVARI